MYSQVYRPLFLLCRPLSSTVPAIISVPHRVMLGPGLSEVLPRVLEALAFPTTGHLDPVFMQLIDDIRGKLRHGATTQNGDRVVGALKQVLRWGTK